MTDIHRHNLLIRYWTPYSMRSFLRNLWSWLDRGYSSLMAFEFRTQYGTSRCYCPVGSQTRLHLAVFGFGFSVWFDRRPARYPCPCDRVSWWLSADEHADEIEEYGRERFIAEFPEPYKP